MYIISSMGKLTLNDADKIQSDLLIEGTEF